MTDTPFPPERPLAGGSRTEVTEAGGVVFRSPGPQSPTVIALLRHLEDAGFPASPRVVGTGFDPEGRETLAYIEGESPQPRPWSDEALASIGDLVCRLHVATATFVPPPTPRWQPSPTRDLPGDRPVIGHGDLGPWNILARNDLPVAFIDWDTAGPVDATWDLALAAWLNVALHDDDVAELTGLAPAATRARQLRGLVDAYGLDRVRRERFVSQLAEVAIHDAAHEAVSGAVTPGSTDAVDATGFPVMWAIAWRARSAAWILRHRTLLERALGA